MRGLGVQDALVALLAAAALGWLVWRRVRRRGAACADCPGCAMGRHAEGATPAARVSGEGGALIPLSELTRRR